MTVIPNLFLNSRTDMVRAIRLMQIDLGRPVCASIDDQSTGQQVVVLQKYLSTVPDGGYPSGYVYDPAKVKSNIPDFALPGAIVELQVLIAGASGGGTPTGDGTMDFSIATGDDTGLLALLEDI